jgi:hypothetical protein
VLEKGVRRWRTRKDPFADVWESEVVPMLRGIPGLTPRTLFEVLGKKYPGKYTQSQLRTFQRRVREWKALEGPGREVIFLQKQQPGRMGLSDFTVLKRVEITIKHKCFHHRLYHFRLGFSGWCDVKVILGGESYTALAEGLQQALWKLGRVPQEHRTDSLSAAYRNLCKESAEDVTRRYEALCSHYGMKASRNNRGQGHENGGIESPHGHLKHRMGQSLLLRGSCDFDSVEAYQEWIDGIVREINERNRDRIEAERPYLKALPANKTADYTEKAVRVTTASTITVRRVIYTVPSRLIGTSLRLHIFDDRIDGYVGASLGVRLPRVYAPDNNHRARCVDYRHVIESLERKPQAFRYSRIRDELLPSEQYRMIWEWIDQVLEPRAACKMMVGILGLAHRADCETALGDYLMTQKQENQMPTLYALQDRFGGKVSVIPVVRVANHSPSDYDSLLPGPYGKGVTP